MSIARTDTRLESRSTDLLGTAIRLSTLALAAVAISANFTNYGPLIPLLQRELHVTSGATEVSGIPAVTAVGPGGGPGHLAAAVSIGPAVLAVGPHPVRI